MPEPESNLPVLATWPQRPTQEDTPMTGRLDGKVAVITGATSGIGERTAEIFVEQGARVIVAGRSAERGEALAARLGENALFVRTDVANETEVKNMIEQAVDHFGRLDCLFNNAGRRGRGGRSSRRLGMNTRRAWMCWSVASSWA